MTVNDLYRLFPYAKKMAALNKDLLYLIFKELQYDEESIYSCLLVNRTWCEVIVPILWRDHMKDLKNLKKSLNLIMSHLSNETKKSLLSQKIDLSIIQQIKRKSLFNYFRFCRFLNLYRLERIFSSVEDIKNIKKSNISTIINEILELFINRNTSITHLYIPRKFDHQIHLIQGAEYCFADLNFLQCRTNTNKDILEGLSRISTSVETLELNLAKFHNHNGIIKFIEAQTNLVDVSLTCNLLKKDDSFCKTLEESFTKIANTIQYLRISWKPITNYLSHLVNLESLEINVPDVPNSAKQSWFYLERATLPVLKFLKAQYIPNDSLASLIKHTSHLTEINLLHENFGINHIRAIHQNCPNLTYLQLSLYNTYEFENLLTNCQYLSGLVIVIIGPKWFKFGRLFKILVRSSPMSLFKFKIYSQTFFNIRVKSLKNFFDGWKGRRPMLLETSQLMIPAGLIHKYKTRGIIKEYEYNESFGKLVYDDFEWF